MDLTLHIQLLGDFRLAYGEKPVTYVTTGRLQSLLAYLLLHQGAIQPRQHLAFLFWPDSTEAQARNNLRQALHQLKHALPDAEQFLYADTTALWWRADAPFSLDVSEFTRALATADEAARIADQAAFRRALEQAANLYHGDLLPSCYDEWLLPQREQLHQQCQAALEQLISLLEEQREYATAIHYAQRLLRHDSLHEDTYLCLMRLHALNNDRASALRIYHSCATILERELGVVPSPATHAAYTRLVSGDLFPVAPVALPTGTVTFLFTDIEGSTRLWQQHPYIMSNALARHEDILRQAIKRHHGVVFRTVGDAVCAAFAHALDALNAALDAQRVLQAEQWEMFAHTENRTSNIPHPTSRLELRVRMALHTGVVETRAGDYVGHALNRLARILATGHGGQTLLSQATQEILRDVLPPGVAIRTLGTHHLKDLTRPEPICQVVVPDLPVDFPPLRSLGAQPDIMPAALARPPAAIVAPAPLVGRHPEWEQLQAAWQRAAGGQSHFALVIGEAGIGKSRLAEELFIWAGQQGCATSRTRAYAAEGRLSYGPVMEWLRSESLRFALARLDHVWLTEVARLLPELLAEHPDLPHPAPLSEHWQRQRFFEALARAMLPTSQPLLLLIDDLQWCDQETLEWLHFLLRFDQRARLLIIGTARAEELGGQHPVTTLLHDLHRTTDVTEIPLRPLDAAETAKLAANLAGQALGADQAIQLFRETEGNPLFVVETIRSGAKDWALGIGEAPSSGNAHLPPPIPQRVHAVIAGRLAQLSAPAHALAGLAATIGRAFTFDVLAHASDQAEDTLVRGLDELWQRRIVREQGANSYDFSHDKIREVAYAELSPMQRQLLHRRVARTLETSYAGDSDAISGQVAAQYEQAGMPDQAIQYYQRAAEVAQRVYANEEAISLFNKGLVLLQRLPPSLERDTRELALQTALATCLAPARGYGAPEVIAACGRAQSLCQSLGEPASPPILRALAIAHVVRAEFQQAHDLGDQLLGLAERAQDIILLVEAHYALGVTVFWQGDFAASRWHLEQAIDHYDPQLSRTHIAHYSQDPKVICLNRLGLSLWYLGYPDQADQRNQEALALAQELSHPLSLAYTRHFGALLYSNLRETKRTQAHADAVIALDREQRVGFYLAMATVLHGWAIAEQGDIDAGIALIRESLAGFETVVAEHLRHHALILLAEQYGKAGERALGLSVLAEARAAVNLHAAHWCDAEIDRVHGVLLLLGGDAAAAEGAFQRALEVARSQAAKSLELRAATSLARLWQTQGKPAAAHQLLAEIYGWFSEGFGTPDLLDARALLDQL